MAIFDVYQIVNNLANDLFHGTTTPVDEKTFVDFGKRVNQLSSADITNNILPKLMQKVTKTYFTVKEYSPNKIPMFTDTSDTGTIELLTQNFYSAMPSFLWNLQDGQDFSADMNTYVSNEQGALYYVMTDTFKIKMSTTTNAIRAAFTSPAMLDRWLNARLTEVKNSINVARENLRRSLLVAMLYETVSNSDVTPTASKPYKKADSQGERAAVYPLVSLYNNIFSPETPLNASTAIKDPKFMSWACSFVDYIADRMSEPSNEWNGSFSGAHDGNYEVESFTAEPIRLMPAFIKSRLKYMRDYNINPHTGAIDLDKYNTVGYFNAPGDPYSFHDGRGGMYVQLFAVLYDEMTMIELTVGEKVTSHYVGAEDFTNYWHHVATRLMHNRAGSRAVFTLQ